MYILQPKYLAVEHSLLGHKKYNHVDCSTTLKVLSNAENPSLCTPLFSHLTLRVTLSNHSVVPFRHVELDNSHLFYGCLAGNHTSLMAHFTNLTPNNIRGSVRPDPAVKATPTLL